MKSATIFDSNEPGWEQQEEVLKRLAEEEKDEERFLAEGKRLRDYYERLKKWAQGD